jgi:hypothetical protein
LRHVHSTHCLPGRLRVVLASLLCCIERCRISSSQMNVVAPTAQSTHTLHAQQQQHCPALTHLATHVPASSEAPHNCNTHACAASVQEGNTALHLAAARGQVQVVRQLLCAGADASRLNQVTSCQPARPGSLVVHGALQKDLSVDSSSHLIECSSHTLMHGGGARTTVVGSAGGISNPCHVYMVQRAVHCRQCLQRMSSSLGFVAKHRLQHDMWQPSSTGGGAGVTGAATAQLPTCTINFYYLVLVTHWKNWLPGF